MSINNITLMGRLTFDPELRVTPSGKSVISFSVAVGRQFDKEKTDFIDCTAWNKTADFISKYFKKGDMIALTGRIETNQFTDKNGNNRKSFSITADNVSFCGNKSENNAGSYSQPAPAYAAADNSDFEEIIDDDDDLPF